jgi:hypothetical protein
MTIIRMAFQIIGVVTVIELVVVAFVLWLDTRGPKL